MGLRVGYHRNFKECAHPHGNVHNLDCSAHPKLSGAVMTANTQSLCIAHLMSCATCLFNRL